MLLTYMRKINGESLIKQTWKIKFQGYRVFKKAAHSSAVRLEL